MHKKGAYREAYALLREVMGRRPEWRFGDLYVICANLELTVNDDVAKAGELLGTALRVGCRDMATYYGTSGFVCLHAGERERGLREMERAVELQPHVQHLSELGRALSSNADPRAAQIWGRVLEQEPDDCQAYANLGILAARTGDREKALQMARRAERLNPSPMALLEIARLYIVLGEQKTALDRYAQAERLGQELPASTCAEIASCHFELGDALEGCKWLQEGRRQFPNSKCIQDAWETYGRRCADGQAAEAQGNERGRGEPR